MVSPAPRTPRAQRGRISSIFEFFAHFATKDKLPRRNTRKPCCDRLNDAMRNAAFCGAHERCLRCARESLLMRRGLNCRAGVQ